VSTTIDHHHPPTNTPTTIHPLTSTNHENERICSFSALVGVLHHHHHPPTSKTSAYARFQRWWVFFITITTTHQPQK